MTDKPLPQQPVGDDKKAKPIWLFVTIVLVILLAVKFVLDYNEKKELQEYYQTELTEAQEKLAEIDAELQQKIREIDSLGGDIEELLAVQQQLTEERDQLQRTRKANRQLIARLKRKTEGYEELLKAKDKEIEELKKVNQALLSENTDLKEKTNELNRSLTELNEDKKELQQKVELAARLKAENIRVMAVTKSGKEKSGVLKSRQLVKLKVTFNIAKNEVAPLETKEILIRVIDENGQVIFDVSRGSGSFILNGKETFYTAAQDVLFDNSGQQLTFEYEKGSRFDPGQYKVEVYTDGYLMGEAAFIVK